MTEPKGKPDTSAPGLAAGAYTTITLLNLPQEAPEGTYIPIIAQVRNNSSVDVQAAVTAVVDGIYKYFGNEYPWIAPGESYDFYDHFTMPDHDVDIICYSLYWGSDGQWHYDDEIRVTVALAAAGGVFSNLSAAYRRVP